MEENINVNRCEFPNIKTIRPDGTFGEVAFVDSKMFFTKDKRYDIQFNIDNTDGAAVDLFLQLGSFVGNQILGNNFDLGLALDSACNNSQILDDYGTNVRKVQAFSLMTTAKPLIIDEIFISSTDANQGSQAFKYKTIQPDFTPVEILNNVLATQEKSDKRLTLSKLNGLWILDSNSYLETKILAGKAVSIMLSVKGYANVRPYIIS